MACSDPDVTRRQLLLSGGAAAVGYAMAVRPASAAAIETDPEGLITGPVTLPTDAGPIQGFRARPEGVGPFPVVIVVHEIFGVHAYVRDLCLRLAREGYFAVAPDLYQRHGDVTRLANVGEIIEKVVKQVDDARVLADLDATLAWAEADPAADAERAAITGFCWGGRIVWLYAAHNPKLDAGVAWYGRLVGAPRPETPKHPLDLVPELRAPVLGLYGSEDRGIPLETVDAMRKELAVATQPSEIVVFPAVPHGFHADYRPSYRPVAAARAGSACSIGSASTV